MKVDILAFGAHPDDVELACCGTLLNARDLNKKIAVVDLTQGELGTRGNATLRRTEALASAEILGLEYRHNLGLRDGFFDINEENLLKVVQEIRFAQPDVILANSLSDRHPDHGRGAELVQRAVFLSGLAKIETYWQGEQQHRWRPRTLYHYIQDRNLEPNLVVDISDNFEKKLDCIRCFSSQFYDPKSAELSTPISKHDFFEFVAGKAKTYGRHIGAEYAEMFNVNRYLGVKDITSLI